MKVGKISDGKTETSNMSSTSQYDVDGNLTRSFSQYSGKDRDGKSVNNSNDVIYEYQNGRVVKANYTTATDGKTNAYSQVYEYDMNGRVTKCMNITTGWYTSYEYSGDRVQKITRVENGITVNPLVEYNAQGLPTKYIETIGGYTDEYRYQYNSEGLFARQEYYFNSKPLDAQSREYDTQKNPYESMYASKKGISVLPSTRPRFTYQRNYTKITSYQMSAAGQWEATSNSIYTHSYNAKGFPTESPTKSYDNAGVETYSDRHISV